MVQREKDNGEMNCPSYHGYFLPRSLSLSLPRLQGLIGSCRILFKGHASIYHMDNFGATPIQEGLEGPFKEDMRDLWAELRKSTEARVHVS